MPITIRDVREHELDSVLALNNAAGDGAGDRAGIIACPAGAAAAHDFRGVAAAARGPMMRP